MKEKHKSRSNPRWYSAEIRNYAKNWNPTLLNNPCRMCGYSTHTELCHIKAIKDFNDNISLDEINHPTNLIVLCPNHHWEFDNGVISIEEIDQVTNVKPSPDKDGR